MTSSWDGCLSQLLGFHQNEVGKCPWDQFVTGTLPETNIAAENMLQKRKRYSNHQFSVAMLVSGRVYSCL